MRCFSIFLFVLLLAFPCRGAEQPENYQIMVSIAPQRYIVERIAKDTVQVMVLAASGQDPHSYEPTPAQMRASSKAALYIAMGVPFENIWLPRIQGVAPSLRVLHTEGVVHGHDSEDDPHESGHSLGHRHDPHIWLSPDLVKAMVPLIEKELSMLLPHKASFFAANAKAFVQDIEQLQQALHTSFAPFPEKSRVFFTFHPAWGYFAEEFTLKEYSIEAEGKEPSPKKMRELIDAARAYGIKHLFIEPQFPKSAARTIAESLGAKLIVVDPLQENWLELMQVFGKQLVDSFAALSPVTK